MSFDDPPGAEERLWSWQAVISLPPVPGVACLVLACSIACGPTTPVDGGIRERAAASVESADPLPSPSSQETLAFVAEPACELVDPPPGLVDVQARIPSAIIVAGYHRDDNFTGAPLPGYEGAGAWLEADAAAALVGVAARLEADGLRLIIYDAYRPRRASEAMVEWCRSHDREDLLDEGWVAPRSAHGRGRAVDLGLAKSDGTPLDMGSAWDQFDARSYLRGAEGAALEHRLQLRAELIRGGFKPYAREWWHFGFDGDHSPPTHDVAYACR